MIFPYNFGVSFSEFSNFSSFVKILNRIMALRKIKHSCRDADYSKLSTFVNFWGGLGWFRTVFVSFLFRFTRITTHSCYTVGYFVSESQNKGLRHVRTWKRQKYRSKKVSKVKKDTCRYKCIQMHYGHF